MYVHGEDDRQIGRQSQGRHVISLPFHARTLIFAHVPKHSSVRFSNLSPRSSETTWPPVMTAKSCNIALRLSPNPKKYYFIVNLDSREEKKREEKEDTLSYIT